ncbi:unnamed protein product [Triticum turgidum subsp. durum]|uniref:Receptor kinase-like protein Xa21 n=1 Tax=Triticum turgidum subsp. durum TaxID=4567 RepID=A0A9R0YMY7_TRITD|nr:unnamed protein product [Triticum turgidum subsp. durum]
MADETDVCGFEEAVKLLLNPWGLSQLSIQPTLQNSHTTTPANLQHKRLSCCALRPSTGNIDLMAARRSFNLTSLVLTSLLLLFYGAGNADCFVAHNNSTERRSLLDFKEAITKDPTGVLSSWNDSIQYCMWPGVTCSLKHPGRVTVLNLESLKLAGQISPSLGNLTLLRQLLLGTNLLQGSIPETLPNCSKLVVLNLAFNMLVGSIPRNIGFLTNLQMMDLSNNKLTGNIPSTFSNITQLQQISLANNQLEGSIPEEFGKLSNVLEVRLGANALSGRVPTALFNLSYLQVLDLSINMLSGRLPSEITGDMMFNLQYLLLGINKFEGDIPGSLGNASQLTRVDFSLNSFTGQIPSSLGKLNYLEYLNLDHNKLEARDSQSWEFLSALSTCPLTTLSLNGNQLHGVLPNSLGNLSITLQQLNLGANNLSGAVPPGIGKYHNLSTLTLSYNNLTGTIEKWIGALKNLEGLDLGGNNFNGPIPYSIGNLTKLTSLDISKNQFDGVMPSSIGNFPQLTHLDLSYNNIQGSIPLQVSNLEQLIELYLSSNKLTGEIPTSLDQCHNLVTIQMGQNMLIGEIPTSLGNLKSLNMLNLSHNNLSGTIPSKLNDLQLLRMLDLSYNHLQGVIPRNGVFENASAISLVGNWGLCGGAPNLHIGSCHAGSLKSRRQYYLIKILIPVFGFMSLAILIYFVLTEKKRRKYTSQLPFGKEFLKVSHKDLEEATENFSESNLIGKGSYGSVYKGKLGHNKMEVAVKVFDLEMHGAEKSFLAECEAVRNIQHRNLLPIITACSTADTTGNAFKALVYEFMPNGNLETWLHHNGDGKDRKPLGFTKRISIALNIANVLDYLHHDIGTPIIHCDLKPSNILLDHDMIAYLGDFGIARFFRDSRLTSRGENSSNGLRGTIGYIPPEYAGGGRPSTCGDAYSFGVLLLEMLTGKRPTDSMFENGVNIINFVDKNFPDQLFEVIDIPLQEECKGYTTPGKMVTENVVYQCLLSLVQVALSCTREIPSERMNMKEAGTRLSGINASYLAGKDKYAS